MTPKELANLLSNKIEKMGEREIKNLSPADTLTLGLLQNLVGVMVTISNQLDEAFPNRKPQQEVEEKTTIIPIKKLNI